MPKLILEMDETFPAELVSNHNTMYELSHLEVAKLLTLRCEELDSKESLTRFERDLLTSLPFFAELCEWEAAVCGEKNTEIFSVYGPQPSRYED